MNAEFQRIARRDKKAFLNDQCKEIKENNRMGKTKARVPRVDGGFLSAVPPRSLWLSQYVLSLSSDLHVLGMNSQLPSVSLFPWCNVSFFSDF